MENTCDGVCRLIKKTLLHHTIIVGTTLHHTIIVGTTSFLGARGFLNSNKKMGLDFSHKKKGFGKTRENYCSKKGYNLFLSLLSQSDVKFTSG